MRPRSSFRLVSFALALGSAAASSWCPDARAADEAPAEAPDVEQARKHFGQGLKLYKDADFDAALVQFERAYALKPNFKVLYNIAQCEFELHQYVEARDALARYLKDGAGNIDAERKAAVETDLTDLQRRVARLLLVVNVRGATVYVDGKRRGVTPLEGPLDVSEGQRTISIETPERGTKQRVVRVAGGEQQTVNVDFEAIRTPAVDARSRTAAPRPSGLGAGFWASGIGALALGAGAGVTGYLALATQAERNDDRKRPGVTRRELDDDRRRVKNFALATDILAAGALLCAGTATVISLTRESEPQQWGLGVGPTNLELRGRF